MTLFYPQYNRFYLIAFGKPAGHRWKPAREAEEKRRRRRRRKEDIKGDRWKRREIAPREIDVHARWKPEREAEEKRIRRRGRRRNEDRAVDQKQLE